MKQIVAVSGGVDSVVLLDIMARGKNQLVPSRDGASHEGVARASGGGAPQLNSLQLQVEGHAPPELIVAHVDHGIRGEESAADARFVEALAKSYRLPYVQTELQLGIQASEEIARDGRYKFLFEQARKFQAEIVTAHHGDDMLGSIAINLQRGTGWRGLSVLSRAGVKRPLLGWTKQSIYNYAVQQRLEWTEDATNSSDKYLRNRLRRSIRALPNDVRSELIALRADQLQLTHDIDYEIRRILQLFSGSRYHYGTIDSAVAVELLRAQFVITRPQAELALLAIKTARAGSIHVVDGRLRLRFTKTEFIADSHP